MTASDPKLPEPDLSGHTLDRYHLLRRLGVGGMGAVYEAEHTRLRKRFAVKLLRYDLARNETFRHRFLREARAASAISHPNVVAISDFGETDDHVFFVMEMLAGRDLQELLDTERKLPWPRTRDILVQVVSALQAAHAQDIIHRDIKPSNVFLADVPGKEDEDYVKVLDFGIAKLSGHMGEATAKLTSTDEIFGTVVYMAPEMAMGVNDDRRSDVYAVGVMMYRMLTGVLPYTQGNAFQILSQHLHAPLPSPRAEDPSIPEPVEAIVLRALAKRPEERFASMDDFGRALRRSTLDASEPRVEPTVIDSGSPGLPAATLDPPRSLLPRFLLLGTGVAALATSITLLVLRDPEPSDPSAAPPTQITAVPAPKDATPSLESTPNVEEPVATPAPRPADEPPIAEPAEPTPTNDPASDEPPRPASTSHASPKPKPKPKPKTDAEVVAALRAKLGSKCQTDGTTKVKIEGMITSTGTTTGLLITPSTGPGACASEVVAKARFDATAGPRPIPRFSVEL